LDFSARKVGPKKGAGPLAGRRGENRAVDEHEVLLVVIVAEGLLDLGAHPEDGVLPVGAEPEVTVVHQEVDAVLLAADRIVLGEVDQADIGNPQFETAGAPGIFLDHPVQFQ